MDKYIDVHSKDHKLVGQALAAPLHTEVGWRCDCLRLQMHSPPINLDCSPCAYGSNASVSSQGGEESAERSTASFMLQLGLRSFAGGNIDAASHRLSICEQQLRTMLPDADAGRDAAGGGQPGAAAADEQLSIQLGAVCGSLGDCHRRLGNAEEAASSYRESVVQLQQCAVPSDEVGIPLPTSRLFVPCVSGAGSLPSQPVYALQCNAMASIQCLPPSSTSDGLQVKHALSVSLNKLGDLQHWRGGVRDACHCYQAALSLRRELAQSANEERGVGMQLDLAVSLIKVANAEQALDDADLAQPLLEEARKMTEDIAGRVEDADKASMAKLRSVQAYFDSTT